MPFAKNMGKNISNSVSKNLSSKYSQKLLDHAKKFVTDALTTSSKRVIQKKKKKKKKKKATVNLVGNKTANKIIGFLKNLQRNSYK